MTGYGRQDILEYIRDNWTFVGPYDVDGNEILRVGLDDTNADDGGSRLTVNLDTEAEEVMMELVISGDDPDVDIANAGSITFLGSAVYEAAGAAAMDEAVRQQDFDTEIPFTEPEDQLIVRHRVPVEDL